ncbi:MAG: hypothetical protein EOO52_15880 [Gammaproteobacteria bacterium]|nr:MAG: hypothetical protein EOO52_15880 [Gammaproteobacteria bacterium]
MRPSFKLVSIGSFALAIVLFTLIFTREGKVVAVAAQEPEVNDKVVTNYIEKVELQNAQERDERQEAYTHQKMAKAKKESVECQFWTQQQAAKPSSKGADKVKQFCELSSDASSESSTASNQPTSQKAR